MSSLKDTPNAIKGLSEKISRLQDESRVQSKLIVIFTGVIAAVAVVDLILRLCGK